jgi:hypothetical protein
VAQHSASLPGVARGGFLLGWGIGCGVLLGINQVTWTLVGAVAAGLAVALVRGVDVERAALTTSAMLVGVIGATAIVVWFGPWAWASFSRTIAPIALLGLVTLQIGVILVLFGAVFIAALLGTTTGVVARRAVRAATHRS